MMENCGCYSVGCRRQVRYVLQWNDLNLSGGDLVVAYERRACNDTPHVIFSASDGQNGRCPDKIVDSYDPKQSNSELLARVSRMMKLN